jgi:hypothetical protein
MGAGRVLPRNLLPAEDTAASGWRSAVHPEDVERHVDMRGVSVANGEPLEDEARFRRNDVARSNSDGRVAAVCLILFFAPTRLYSAI